MQPLYKTYESLMTSMPGDLSCAISIWHAAPLLWKVVAVARFAVITCVVGVEIGYYITVHNIARLA